ncbi:peptidase M23 [Williamsia sp. 1138]|uniref:M23 family metallopeptidase n=1 Tax=Williamsia sp. 1138 TaxID=1903117 RepID=UPI000A11FE94|nr:M23 family metallopeptidase [Williamsia sp. 1138]OZG29777.1 peptidase M23 [Williamsia sp. 1138]
MEASSSSLLQPTRALPQFRRPGHPGGSPRPRAPRPQNVDPGYVFAAPAAPWERALCAQAPDRRRETEFSYLERLDAGYKPVSSARSVASAGISGSLVAAAVLLAAGGTATTALADPPHPAITPVSQVGSHPAVAGQDSSTTPPATISQVTAQAGSPSAPTPPAPAAASPLDALTTAMRDLVQPNRGAPPEPAPPPRPKTAAPTYGTLTSSYGSRWDTTHYGLDIANVIGTPVVSTSDGEIIESGPADGFGLWIRVLQDDGTIGVYGHINETLVSAGQRVQAGEQIATVGNRGYSTGPHLHYEVWQQDGLKLDPAQWLSNRGIDIG